MRQCLWRLINAVMKCCKECLGATIYPGLAGKSTIAQALASRLNLPNVLQTDVVYEVSLCLL